MTNVEHLERLAEQQWIEDYLTGPTHTRFQRVPIQVGDTAPDLELPDTTGTERNLSEFWSEQPLVLQFMRHFGCGCLAERWKALQAGELETLESEGAKVVMVFQAEPERTAVVADRRGYPRPVLSDPDMTAYRTFGVLEGEPSQVIYDWDLSLGDRKTAEELVESRRGTEQALFDHPWQLPAEFVIGQEGEIVLAHRYQHCEDYPPLKLLVGALRSLG
jgi:peroxiredoxin